jgi:prophage maintenance system killer protein
MADEPRWVSAEAVVALNREIVAASGTAHAVVNSPGLQAAVQRPWNTWVYFMDRDFAVLAAALMAAVYSARPFAAGNRVTAYRAAVAFLDANGFQVDLGDNRRALEQVFAFFDGRLSQRAVVEWFRMWMEPRY